jgi:hypothetical protein
VSGFAGASTFSAASILTTNRPTLSRIAHPPRA